MKLSERTPFTLSVAVLVALLSASATAASIWSRNESARDEQTRQLADHEARMQRLESKMEDVTTMKNDIAWMKRYLERQEQRSSRAE